MSHRVLDEHLAYWADDVKVDRYRQALARVLRPGGTVLDLGSGTGLLGLLACEAGAGKVYAVDDGPIASVAREMFAANGVSDRVDVVQARSFDVDLPGPVDVLVGDQAGGFAYTSGVFAAYADAARRLLAPGGVTIPSHFDLLVALVTNEPARNTAWPVDVDRVGFDLSPLRQLVRNNPRTVHLAQTDLLSEPVSVHRRLATDDRRIHISAEMEVRRQGTLDGIAGMFTATLAPEVTMSNVPGRPDQLRHRWQDLFPVDSPLEVVGGDAVTVTFDVNPTTYLATWHLAVERPDGSRSGERHSTFEGRLLDSAALRPTGPDGGT